MENNIIHVISSLLVGGAERFVLDLAKQQLLDGHNVKILNLGNTDDPLLDEASKNDIPVITVPTKRILISQLSIIKLLCAASIVHIHNAVSVFRIFPYIPFLKGSVIYTIHSEQKLRTITKVSHIFLKHKLKALTFVSKGSKEAFYKQFNWKKTESIIIDNGVFIPSIKNTSSTSKIKIITIGRMIPLKRQSDLLEVAAGLSPDIKKQIELHFYGDGPLRNDLQNQSNELGIESTFHGMELDRNRIYSEADISVCTSETEGLSIALLESMAWSIPIIATNVGGNPKCVEDTINGYLYEWGDLDELSKHLIDLINNEEKRINMGRKGKDRVKRLFSIQQSANEYYECYWN